MASNFAARQLDIYTIVSTSPSVNLTPIGPSIVPIPYNVSETLEKSADVSETVSMGGAKVYLKKSHSSSVVGDGPGVCCGVSSGTLLAKSYVIEHSATTKVDGSEIIRVGDEQFMQGGNTKGKVTGSEGGSPSSIKDDGEIDGSTIPEDLDIQSIITALTPISFSSVMNMSNKTNPMASSSSGTLGSSTGSPVILNTAQFIHTNKDIKLLNGKSPLLLEQTYVSKQDYNGMFGNNTRYAYESQFKKIENNTYRLFLIDAKKFDFELQEDNTFKNIGKYPCIIECTDENTFNITFHNTNEIHTYKNDKLIKIQEPNDNCINILYENNLLKKVSNNNGAFFDFTYSQNKVSNVRDDNKRLWTYNYDKKDNLIEIINPASNKKTFSYDEKNNLINIQDENENDIVSVIYDEDNMVQSYTKQELTNTYTYISTKMISKEDNLGNITNYGLDDCGQIRAILAKNKNSESYVYDEVNNTAVITDINNSKKTKHFDDKSRVVKIVYEDKSETLYTYEETHNNPLSILEANGNITTYVYDKKINLTQHVKANGDTIAYEYDDKSNLVKSVDIQGCETKYDYNEFSCMIKKENALGVKTFYTYDTFNRNICIINAKDKKEFLEYDILNNNTKYINALEDRILFTYDKTNKLTSITDTKNNKTQYVYDNHNRIVKVINAKDDEKVYTYNLNNTISSLTQEDGQTSTYKYNTDEQLTQVNNSDGTITYSYNNLGQLLQANNNTASIENYYNKNSQLITQSINDIDIDKVYDTETHNLNMVLFKDKQYSFKRDDNNIQEIINKKDVIQLSKNNYNITTNIIYPNELSQEKTYNALYNITNVKTNNQELTYTHDELGLVVLKEHTQDNNTSKKAFFYDDINRLIKSDITNFTYDEAGNKLNHNEQYSNTHELEEDDTFYYVYDKRGNIKEKVNKSTNDSISYTFNASNLLISVSSNDNKLEFTYDALQRRISKKHNGILHNYLYDNYNIIAILDESKELIASIIHDENIDSPLSITTYAKSQLSKDEYNALSEEKQVEHDNTLENTYFYHSDNQGSIIALTNKDAKIVESFIYDDAYGVILEHQKTIETLNPYGYTAQVFDTNELYYYKARYYDPTTQRFLSPDAIEFKSGDYNFYRYVNNSPLNFTDPSGLNAFSFSSMSDFFSSLLPSYAKPVDNPIAFAADSLAVAKTPNADIDKIDAKSSSSSGSDGGKVVGEGKPAVEAKFPPVEVKLTSLYFSYDKNDLPIKVKTHEVQKNETLSQIGQKYSVSFQEIAKANGIKNVNIILVGQVLLIPNKSEKTSKKLEMNKLNGSNIILGSKVYVTVTGTPNETVTVEVLADNEEFEVIKDGTGGSTFDVTLDDKGESQTLIELRPKNDEQFKELISEFEPIVGQGTFTKKLTLKASMVSGANSASLENDDMNTTSLEMFQSYIKNAYITDPITGHVYAELKVTQENDEIIFTDPSTNEIVAKTTISDVVGITSHGNNALGGFGLGMTKINGTFQLVNRKQNSALYRFRHHENNFAGYKNKNGGIKTYSYSKWGARVGKVNFSISVVLGVIQIRGAYQYDKSRYNSEEYFGNVGAQTEQQVGSTALGFAGGAVAGYIVLGIFAVITAPAWVALGTAVVIGGVAGWAMSELGDEAIEQIQEYKGSTIINGYDVNDSDFKD